MTDKKLTDLAPVIDPADTDLAYLVVDPGGSPESRNIVLTDLLRRAEGNLSTTGGAVPQTLGAGSPAKVATFTASESVINVTADDSDDSIVLPDIGRYHAIWQCTFSHTVAAELQFEIYWNGDAVGVPGVFDVPDSKPRTVTVSAPFSASTAGQKVECYVTASVAGDVTISEQMLFVNRTG